MSRSLGHGIGLRTKHYRELLERGSPVPCVEAITENFIGRGGRPRALLERVRRDAHVLLHGVSLSIGSTDPLRLDYVDALAELAREIDARVVSDHLCYASVAGHYGHDLWPVPLTEEALEHVVARVGRVQDRLRRRIALENPSTYVAWTASTIPEEEFLAEVARRAGCDLLLDLNNVHVSATNHAFDPRRYIETLPRDRVVQFHVAGHSVLPGGLLFDDHGSHVDGGVWALHRAAVERFGDVTCIVEWDDRIPTLDVLVAEAARARASVAEVERAVA